MVDGGAYVEDKKRQCGIFENEAEIISIRIALCSKAFRFLYLGWDFFFFFFNFLVKERSSGKGGRKWFRDTGIVARL